jgi:hypothetical protein
MYGEVGTACGAARRAAGGGAGREQLLRLQQLETQAQQSFLTLRSRWSAARGP